MALPVLLGCLWVLAAAAVAFLPMRMQILPGLALLAAAIALIVWLARDYGAWAGLPALGAVVSMFRKPLHFFAKAAIWGRAPDLKGREP